MKPPKFPKYTPETVVCYEDHDMNCYVFSTVIAVRYFPDSDMFYYVINDCTDVIDENDLVRGSEFSSKYYPNHQAGQNL